jgi:hypothetical protein
MNRRHMNVEIGTETAQIPEKEYINGIFVAVYWQQGYHCARNNNGNNFRIAVRQQIQLQQRIQRYSKETVLEI